MVLFLLSSSPVHAKFESVSIQDNTERAVGGQCAGSDSKIRLSNGRVDIVDSVGRIYPLGLSEEFDQLNTYLGASYRFGPCVIAIKYAENDVNESFYLIVFDDEQKQFKLSNMESVTNPDFIENGILSEYKDGPFTYNDKFCYSKKRKDYYVCEKGREFSESLERREKCSETSCADPEILRLKTGLPLEATVSIEKVNLLEKSGESSFSQKKAYLVLGDKVTLSDYYRDESGLYYKVVYRGKIKTTGWISEKSIVLND